MENSTISAVERDRVLTLQLCRPERKNALNLSMYERLSKEFTRAAQEESVRAVVLTGSDGVFTAGNDLEDFLQNAKLQGDSPVGQFLWAFATFPKPIVVAIDGPAIGIGSTLLLHCDLSYASPRSEFKLPFANLGLCPEFASSYLLPRLVGLAKANQWLMLGESFSAEEASASGLINGVVDAPLLHAQQIAQRLAGMPPNALRKTKALLKASVLPKSKKAMAAEIDAFVELLQGPEFAEAVSAFFEKRDADFSQF